jgi:group II intron reverse transcriptase/maturase
MLETPERISQFQRKLFLRAKQQPKLRFYSLYDKIYREDILEYAYHLVYANGGSAGIDGITFEQIGDGEEKEAFLTEIKEVLRDKTYKAQPVRRVYIPKADGSKRPLGIPTIRDRVIQMATKIVIEPIFEADFCDSSYGFRPKRSAHDALDDISSTLLKGHTKVIDADISKYFDTIPHSNLMKAVAKRICDKEVLHLINLWLKAPIVEEDENGKKRYTGGKKNKKGTPQGGVISPLLANIYLHLMDETWEINEFVKKLGAKLIRYADDFVILCRKDTKEPLQRIKQILLRLELNLNEKKTHVVNAYKENFNFLGFEFQMRQSSRSKKWYPHVQPSAKSLDRIKKKITNMTNSKLTLLPIEEIVKSLNRTVRGWSNYFHYGNCSQSLSKVRYHAEERLRTHLRKRHKVIGRMPGYIKYPSKMLYEEYGLYKVPTSAGWKKRML